ncbi:MAG: substrate-binding domain-containing protein [Candidatus Acidiferrales bacterium]
MMPIKNRLQMIRQQRGLAAAQLARDVGISRPTIYAIEAGNYTPNTTVALRLARALECSVEDMFSLEREDPSAPPHIKVKFLSSGMKPREGQSLQLCRVGDATVGVPAANRQNYLPDADGIISRFGPNKSEIFVNLLAELNSGKRIVVGGCDPATSILGAHLGRLGFEVIAASCDSRCALEWLKSGLIHIAGCHLHDTETNEYNVPFVKRLFKKGDVRVVAYVAWEQGLVIQHGNPKTIRGVKDLARKNVRMTNREIGSGARQLLDSSLGKAGVASRRLLGYGTIARGHIPAALAVSVLQADCCIATRSAARYFGLEFIPLASERYDFVIPQRYWDLPAVQAFLEVLARSRFRHKLEAITGYDATHAGELRM